MAIESAVKLKTDLLPEVADLPEDFPCDLAISETH